MINNIIIHLIIICTFLSFKTDNCRITNSYNKGDTLTYLGSLDNFIKEKISNRIKIEKLNNIDIEYWAEKSSFTTYTKKFSIRYDNHELFIEKNTSSKPNYYYITTRKDTVKLDQSSINISIDESISHLSSIYYEESDFFRFDKINDYLIIQSNPTSWTGNMTRNEFYQLIDLKSKKIYNYVVNQNRIKNNFYFIDSDEKPDILITDEYMNSIGYDIPFKLKMFLSSNNYSLDTNFKYYNYKFIQKSDSVLKYIYNNCENTR